MPSCGPSSGNGDESPLIENLDKRTDKVSGRTELIPREEIAVGVESSSGFGAYRELLPLTLIAMAATTAQVLLDFGAAAGS